jgi:hypothetical protein
VKFIVLVILILLSGFMYEPFSLESADAFTEKMKKYFDMPTNYSMLDLPNDWWSATLATGFPLICTSTVYLSTRWEGSASPLWKYSLVHEWVHVSQGARCVNNEKETRLETFRILTRSKEWGALIASVNHFVKMNEVTMNEVIEVIRKENG